VIRNAPIRKDFRAPCKAAEFDSSILHFARSKSRTPNEEYPDIGAQFVLHMAKRLAQEAFRTAAHSSAPEFFSGGKADLARNACITQDIENHPPPRDRFSLLIDVLKVAAPLNHLRARQCVSFSHIAKKEVTRVTSDRLQLLRRQLLSSALTPSLEYEAAAFRLHALTESMCLFSPMVVGLKCSLHLTSPPLLPLFAAYAVRRFV